MEISGYNFPEELFYDPEHYWVRVEGDELVMGMDDFAQKLAGDIVFVQLPDEGKKLKKGKKLAKVESGKWLGKILSPVNGELIAVNEELEISPELINQDCYGAGWMYRLKAKDLSELDDLLHGAEAITPWVEAEIAKHATEG
ncbi:MAG: glycine cleavage system protein GcvH [Desulfarculaceae bacterium]|nr:glycine cleavage system protein GcvH [Desulfarculaceae bacterium]MCF8071158.1 glycine cleavage system protein GcvH [Desulfarculaceae bacterium]MCF8101239.1 glycine cleavage system protein GcvH [Desulfarculaceae bacterium]MCF8115212.1 glycine cleavage system protein GcvH [Desulfarculaceae bacterium]